MKPKKEYKTRLQIARLNAGYSQADVQRILGFLNRKTLCAYEKDVLNPTNKVLCLLPQLYGVKMCIRDRCQLNRNFFYLTSTFEKC